MPKTMSARSLMKKLDKLFSSPDKWTRGWFAKDQAGIQCSARSPNAACFCFLGGCIQITKVTGTLYLEPMFPLVIEHAKAVTRKEFTSIACFNDASSFKTVKKVIGRVIDDPRSAKIRINL